MSWKEIQRAQDCLMEGQLVAIPTETVYGLAARMDKEESIRKIFKVKERPFFDPLIVHIGRKEQLPELVESLPPDIDQLYSFWPGPLTLVLKKSKRVPDLITAGLPTVAVRMPAHPFTRRLLRSLPFPIAAPSANRFGKTSPTTAAHVKEEFPNEDLCILDGGPCHIGIESTVLKVSNRTYSVLRPGPISTRDLESLGLQVDFHDKPTTESPGQLQHHYQPDLPLVLSSHRELTKAHLDLIKDRLKLSASKYSRLELSADAPLAARELYGKLRERSKERVEFVVFTPPNNPTGDWRPLWDRLTKASSLSI